MLTVWSYQKQSEVYTANIFQAPSILSETESSIERSLGQFSGDMANLDSAVKALSSVAVDQAGKYKNSIKKDYQVLVITTCIVGTRSDHASDSC